MPGGDGTGPLGRGPVSGGGRGRGMGRGRQFQSRSNRGVEWNNDKCVCPNCGEKTVHQRGVPCNSIACPNCGARMVRR